MIHFLPNPDLASAILFYNQTSQNKIGEIIFVIYSHVATNLLVIQLPSSVIQIYEVTSNEQEPPTPLTTQEAIPRIRSFGVSEDNNQIVILSS